MEKVIIIGVTGMIGRKLSVFLKEQGYDVVGLTRRPEMYPELVYKGIRLIRWNGSCPDSFFRESAGAKAVINLAGENISGGRWNSSRKEKIIDTRIMTIHTIQDALSLVDEKPFMYLQASATGYYGSVPGHQLNENGNNGSGFLASVCRDLESEAMQTEGTQVVITRFGLALDRGEGVLARMTEAMRFGIGGYPYPGNNMVSWIDLEDMIRAISHILTLPEPGSIYNLTAPAPVTLKQLVKDIARFKTGVVCAPFPKHLLFLMFGRHMVEETLLTDQYVIPEALTGSGFRFNYPTIGEALRHLLS